MKRKSKKNSRRIVTVLILVGIFATILFSARFIRIEVDSKNNDIAQEATPSNFIEVSERKILEEIKNDTSKIAIIFTSNWCGSCSKMTEELKKLAKDLTGLKFYVADIENYRDIASNYNVAITPALVLIEKSAFTTYQEIRPENLNNYIQEFNLLGI